MIASTSWLDLFDFKFEKYLTPWIVRLTWLVALVVASLWLIVLLFSVVWAIIPSSGDSDLSESSGAEVEFRPPGFESSRPRVEFRPPKLPPRLAIVSPIVITAFMAILVCLLWIRVFLETVVVLFNIANTLKDIDQKLTPGGSGVA